jgi:hypothetical protein
MNRGPYTEFLGRPNPVYYRLMGTDARTRDGAERLAAQRRWDALRRFERAEAAAKLAALTPQEGYEQFLSMYLLFGVDLPEDMARLREADFRDRLAIVARRQRAFAALARHAAEREGAASP